jgi:hypothetical protein
MSPGPKSAPRLGDIPGPADLARRTDRLDRVEDAILRIERKVDMLVAAMLPPAKAKK